MHAAVRRFVSAWAGALAPPARVLEVGSRDVNGSVRDLFGGCEYVGVDARPGPGVDVAADGARWRPDRPFDLVLCLETLEHAADPVGLCRTLVAACRPGGVVLVTAAGPSRTPHGCDGGPVGAEVYANVRPDLLASWLGYGCEAVLVELTPGGEDVRAVALRGRGEVL